MRIVQKISIQSFPYNSAFERLEIRGISVTKTNGTVINTPAFEAQDAMTEAARLAPSYADVRTKQIPVRGLGVGDTLQFQIRKVRTRRSLISSGTRTTFSLRESFGTLIIDEGDFRLSDEKAEIIKILNNGNAKGFPVLRSEATKTREFNPRAYRVYGPKLIATRGYFEDRALESRCLTEEMGQAKLRDDIPINLPPCHKDEGLHLRNKLLFFPAS